MTIFYPYHCSIKFNIQAPRFLILWPISCLVLLFCFGCSDEEVMDLDSSPFEMGFNFRLVDHDYENAPLVHDINPPSYVHASHYVFQSPTHNDQEVGFTMVTSKDFHKGNNKAYVFLHGQGGNENAGFAQYIPYLAQSGELQNDAVYLLLNGITDGGGSWKIKETKGYNPVQAIGECIEGIMNSEEFDFISRNREDWTVIGFSMGGRAAMSLRFNPLFLDWEQIPARIYSMGSWLSTENLNEMIDFDSTINHIEHYQNQPIEMAVINHELDRGGDNSTNLKVDISDNFIANLKQQGIEIPNFHLSLPRENCLPQQPQIDECNVHVLQFYLGLELSANTTVSQFIH